MHLLPVTSTAGYPIVACSCCRTHDPGSGEDIVAKSQARFILLSSETRNRHPERPLPANHCVERKHNHPIKDFIRSGHRQTVPPLQSLPETNWRGIPVSRCTKASTCDGPSSWRPLQHPAWE